MMIRFQDIEVSLHDEFFENVYEINGKILDLNDDDEEIQVGTIEATYIDIVSTINYGEDLFDLFDHHSQELFDHYAEISMEGKSLYHYLLKSKNWLLAENCYNLFFIDKVFVAETHRGKNIGLATIFKTIQRFAHDCRFVILKAVPAQLDQVKSKEKIEIKPDLHKKNEKNAAASLKKHYKKLGFEIVPCSDYMILDLDLRRPNLNDIGFCM